MRSCFLVSFLLLGSATADFCLVTRGMCTFVEKVWNAEVYGNGGNCDQVAIFNNVNRDHEVAFMNVAVKSLDSPDLVTIPSVYLTGEVGMSIMNELAKGVSVKGFLDITDKTPTGPRDMFVLTEPASLAGSIEGYPPQFGAHPNNEYPVCNSTRTTKCMPAQDDQGNVRFSEQEMKFVGAMCAPRFSTANAKPTGDPYEQMGPTLGKSKLEKFTSSSKNGEKDTGVCANEDCVLDMGTVTAGDPLTFYVKGGKGISDTYVTGYSEPRQDKIIPGVTHSGPWLSHGYPEDAVAILQPHEDKRVPPNFVVSERIESSRGMMAGIEVSGEWKNSNVPGVQFCFQLITTSGIVSQRLVGMTNDVGVGWEPMTLCYKYAVTQVDYVSTPVFVEPTPGHETDFQLQKRIPVCVGKGAAKFEVRATCSKPNADRVYVNQIGKFPDGSSLTDNSHSLSSEGLMKHIATRNFFWEPNQDADVDTDLCFQAINNPNVQKEDIGTIVLESNVVCVVVSVRYPPAFIEPTPMTFECDGANVEADQRTQCTTKDKIVCKVGGRCTYEIRSRDKNLEDDVSIFVLEDPGIPNGAFVHSKKCEASRRRILQVGDDAAPFARGYEDGKPCTGDLDCAPSGRRLTGYGYETCLRGVCRKNCNYAYRTFDWVPQKLHQGKTYRTCYLTKDHQDNCQQGGYYAQDLEKKVMSIACVDVEVVGADAHWVHPTPDNGPENPLRVRGTVGCTATVTLAAADSNYCVSVAIHDNSKFIEKNGGFMGEMVAIGQGEGWNDEVKKPCTHVTRDFMWKPVRGEETTSRTVCFTGGNAEEESSAHHAVNPDRDATSRPMITLPPRCVTITVERCKYCAAKGETLAYVNKFFHLDSNWLRIWNSNGQPGRTNFDPGNAILDDPEMVVQEEDRIAVGPIYKVKPGDNLSVLAARFHTSVKTILGVNPDIIANNANVRSKPGLVPSVWDHDQPNWGSVDVSSDAELYRNIDVGQQLCIIPGTNSGGNSGVDGWAGVHGAPSTNDDSFGF